MSRVACAVEMAVYPLTIRTTHSEQCCVSLQMVAVRLLVLLPAILVLMFLLQFMAS